MGYICMNRSVYLCVCVYIYTYMFMYMCMCGLYVYLSVCVCMCEFLCVCVLPFLSSYQSFKNLVLSLSFLKRETKRKCGIGWTSMEDLEGERGKNMTRLYCMKEKNS